MTDIQSWLAAHGLGKYAAEFLAQDISPDLLPDLTDAELRELGIASLGDRKRLLKAVHAAGTDGLPVAAAPAETAQSVSARAVPIEPAAMAPHTGSEEGERRHATVMFSDLTGYTALNEAFDPEEVEAIMSNIKREASAVIERHGGRVNQFVGDEVMALFGVPVARRDDARRAVRAALELHRAVDAIAKGLQARLGRQLSMHTGVHTGLVIARRSDARSGDYTLTGDTVNTAARLRGLAQPGEVVVSPQTWQQVDDVFEGSVGVAVEVKGKERALLPYRITAERAVSLGGSRPLVGRVDEMQQFETLVQACLERKRGRVIFVRGDPGMGKSRLAAEFVDNARERGLDCVATTILDFGARTGHDAIRVLVQEWLGLAADADEATRAAAIAQGIAADGAGVDYQPYLYELLDVTPPADVRALLSAVDATVRRRSMLQSLARLLQAQLARAPTLLLIEDIHWADAWTLEQLVPLLTLANGGPLLAILTTRFAGDPSLGEWRLALHGLPVTSMDLQALGAEDALRLAAGAASISDALLNSCVERAEGNPLFLEQLLLNAGDESANKLPGSIQALIQARMDRLSPSDKSALQAAAVWGQRVPLTVIRHLVGDPAYEIRPLVEQFLLRPQGDDMVFSHALIRDGAYGSMLYVRRRQLHQMAAQWVQDNDVLLAAEHFERAEDPRAAAAYVAASEAQSVQFHFAEALALVDRALKLADQADQAFALHLARTRMLLATGHASEAEQASEQALAHARADGERALVLIAKASAMRLMDRAAEGMVLLQEAQPLAEAAGLTLELSRLHELRGNLLFLMARARECQGEHEKALELARQAGSAEAECAALGGLGDASYALARVNTAGRLIDQCVDMARAQGFLKVEVAYLPMVSWAAYYMLDLTRATEVSRHAIVQASRMHNPRAELMARGQLVMVDGCIRGNHQDGLAQVERALELARTMGGPRFEAMIWFFSALLSLRAEDPAEAMAQLDKAFEIAVSSQQGLIFLGAQLYGAKALIERDALARRAALSKGQELLLQSSLSHNHFVFFDFAIQASIMGSDWDEATRYCAGLEEFVSAEPFAWADFVIARGRALIRAGQGGSSPALRAELQRLHDLAVQRELNYYLPDIASALARLPA